MKKLLLVALSALFSLNISAVESIELTIQITTHQKPAEKAHKQGDQWKGYAAQFASSALIHAVGYAFIKEHCRNDPSRVFAFLVQLWVAKTMQHHISEDIYEFNNNDWAASQNNWAHFWGWVYGILFNLS